MGKIARAKSAALVSLAAILINAIFNFHYFILRHRQVASFSTSVILSAAKNPSSLTKLTGFFAYIKP